MEWKNKGIFFSAGVLLFVLLVGCTSVPKKPKDPYLGFVYTRSIQGDEKFKQDGVTPQLREYMKQIASKELQRRKNKHYFHDKSLEKSEEYIANLKRPVRIEESDWKGAVDDGLNKKEKKALLAYWEANKPLSFDGSESLSAWESSLESAELQFKTDTRIAEGIESEIMSLRKGNHFRDALKKVDKLRPYKSKRAGELTENLKKDASNHWVGVRMSEIKELRGAEVYDGDHEQQVIDLYDKTCIDKEDFDNRADSDFNVVFTGWQDLLSENWRRRIEKMGERKEYWEAYEFARERYRDYLVTDRFDESYRDGLKRKMGKGYFEILDNAVRHYSDLASNACKLKSLDGAAYVYCCMAKEMYDFTTVANLGYNEKTETWYKRISELEENELTTPLSSRVARRLVIHDFELDILGLSKKLRQSCLKKYASGNNHALSLEVVVDKVALAQFEAGSLPVEPDDYLIEWNRAVFDVNRSYGTPETKSARVRTDRIRLVENPFRKDKSSKKFYKLKQVQAQEVDLYSLTETVNGAEIICDMEVICRHNGEKKTFKMPETNKYYEKVNNKLGSVMSVKVALFLASAKTEYYLPDMRNNMIPRDDIPSNSVVTIPNQDWFEERFTGYILADLENELESLIDMYPVELLADADHDGSSKYLDTLGTILFYVANLSSTEAAKQEMAGKGYEWLYLRNQIADDTKKWCGDGGRWAAAGADEKKILGSLWKECIKVGNEQDDR